MLLQGPVCVVQLRVQAATKRCEVCQNRGSRVDTHLMVLVGVVGAVGRGRADNQKGPVNCAVAGLERRRGWGALDAGKWRGVEREAVGYVCICKDSV